MTWYLFSFLIGGAMGSFVNVLAARTIARQSILLPRSFCDACAKPLRRRDMIPIVSYVLLHARCRFCKANIAWQHPVIEFITALLFLVAAVITTDGAMLVLFWPSIIILVTLFLIDLRSMILPDHLTLPAIVIFLLLDVLFLHRTLKALALAMALGCAFFLVQWLVSRGKWVGSGDIRFGVLMGAILGTWQMVGWALMVSYVLGAIVAILLLIMKKKGLKSEIPLGTFLAVGTLAVLFFGSFLVGKL